jgi:hypothetical protein
MQEEDETMKMLSEWEILYCSIVKVMPSAAQVAASSIDQHDVTNHFSAS